jgi:hypothetical protein
MNGILLLLGIRNVVSTFIRPEHKTRWKYYVRFALKPSFFAAIIVSSTEPAIIVVQVNFSKEFNNI